MAHSSAHLIITYMVPHQPYIGRLQGLSERTCQNCSVFGSLLHAQLSIRTGTPMTLDIFGATVYWRASGDVEGCSAPAAGLAGAVCTPALPCSFILMLLAACATAASVGEDRSLLGSRGTPSRGEGEGRAPGSRLSLRVQRLIRRAAKQLQGVPLADGAQRLPAGQPLVDALQVEPVLAGQHPQLLPFPAHPLHPCKLHLVASQ